MSKSTNTKDELDEIVNIIDDIIYQEHGHHINQLKPQIKNGLQGYLAKDRQQLIQRVKKELPERKPHYKGVEAGGYSGNETHELIYSSGVVDALDNVNQILETMEKKL